MPVPCEKIWGKRGFQDSSQRRTRYGWPISWTQDGNKNTPLEHIEIRVLISTGATDRTSVLGSQPCGWLTQGTARACSSFFIQSQKYENILFTKSVRLYWSVHQIAMPKALSNCCICYYVVLPYSTETMIKQ